MERRKFEFNKINAEIPEIVSLLYMDIGYRMVFFCFSAQAKRPGLSP